MKFYVVGILLLTATQTFAQNPDNADPVTKAINAQVQVSRNNIEALKKQIGDLSGNVYNDPQYLKMLPAFDASLNGALARYDDSMTKEILPKAQHWLNAFAKYAENNQKNGEYLAVAVKDVDMNLEIVNVRYNQVISQIMVDAVGDTPGYAVPKKMSAMPTDLCGFSIAKVFSDPKEKHKPTTFTPLDAYDTSFVGFDGKELSEGGTPYCLIWTPATKSFSGTLSLFRTGEFLNEWHGRSQEDAHEAAVKYLAEQIYKSGALGDKISEKWVKGCNGSKECEQLRLNDLIQVADLIDQVINIDVNLMNFDFVDTANDRYGGDHQEHHHFTLKRSPLVSADFRRAIRILMGNLRARQ